MANDGKFILDGKRVEFSDYGGSSKEIDMQHPKDVKGSDKPKSLLSIPVGQRYTTLLDRLDKIESEIEVMKCEVANNSLTLNQIEERIAIMQEKIDGID